MEQWKKNLYALWGMQFVSVLGMSMILPFIPFYIRTLGITNLNDVSLWSGITMGIGFIFSAIFSPIWGDFSDRYGRKVMIIRAVFAIAILNLLMAFARNVYDLLILRILQGCFGGFVGASAALVSTSVPQQKMGYAFGILQTSMIAGSIGGPFIGGVLADLVGYRFVFILTATFIFIGGLIVTIMVKEEKHLLSKEKGGGIIENIKSVFASKQLFVIMLVQCVIQIAVMVLQPILPLFISSFQKDVKYVATITGLVFSSTAITTLFASSFWGKKGDVLGHKKSLSVCLLGSAILMAPHFFIKNIGQLLLLRMGLGVFVAGISPSTQTMITAYIPRKKRGGMMGIANSFSMIGMAMGPLLGGFLGAKFGLRIPFLVTSALLFITFWLVYKLVKEPVNTEFIATGIE